MTISTQRLDKLINTTLICFSEGSLCRLTAPLFLGFELIYLSLHVDNSFISSKASQMSTFLVLKNKTLLYISAAAADTLWQRFSVSQWTDWELHLQCAVRKGLYVSTIYDPCNSFLILWLLFQLILLLLKLLFVVLLMYLYEYLFTYLPAAGAVLQCIILQ